LRSASPFRDESIVVGLHHGRIRSGGEMMKKKMMRFEKGFGYFVENGTATIIDYKTSEDPSSQQEKFVIPDTLGGFPVTVIASNNLFEKRSSQLFASEELVVPEGVTDIEAFPFHGFSLKHISLPSTLRRIGDEVFGVFPSLQSIKVNPDNLYFASDEKGVLFRAQKTSSHIFKDKVLLRYPPGKRDNIYVIPEGTKEIGAKAFEYADNLKHVTFPTTLKTIRENAFAFCENLEFAIIPDNVTSIGEDAFYYCKNLSHLKLPTGLRQIEKETFSNCTSLKEVHIPEQVEYIGDSAFYHCTKLSEMNIPPSVRFIGDFAFYEIRSHDKILLPNGMPHLGEDAFVDYEQDVKTKAKQTTKEPATKGEER
jgi:hypothetical protein